jgi:hypothetical protein
MAMASEDLDTEGTFIFEEIQLLPALDSIPDEPFAGNEFTVHEIGAVLFADISERRIADILHGGQ